MDFRLIDKTREWMRSQGLLGDCDVVALAGASKEIVDGGQVARELLLKQINISCELHKACQVVLVHHSDCGAYKSTYNFSSPAEEKEKQWADMKRAGEIIKESFPEIEIIKVWAQMQDGEGKDVLFQKVD